MRAVFVLCHFGEVGAAQLGGVRPGASRLAGCSVSAGFSCTYRTSM
jgi:hypothetical protein